MTKREHDSEAQEATDEKKLKMFSASEFRFRIQDKSTSEEKEAALSEFLTVCTGGRTLRDSAIFDYFRSGGSCFELLQILESDASVPAAIPVELVAHLILQEIATPMHRSQQSTTLDACRYMLNTHMQVINRMMHLSSTSLERYAILKLLAGMVAFSPILVKDILLNVRFNTTLLTKHSQSGRKDVRRAYIDFLVSFFIDGYYPTIAQLLRNSFMFWAILPGLKYDNAATVQLVLMTLKTHIIENVAIKKPMKFKFFNMVAMRSLVALYDWKGPTSMNTKTQRPIQNEQISNWSGRENIAKLVHECLLVLCTSRNKGLIFNDTLLGTGKVHRNTLMYNVIEMVGEDFANVNELRSQLIIKMAAACSDLVQYVWKKLLPSLLPRPTPQWLNAIRFFHQLIDEIDPKCAIYQTSLLTPLQYAQAIQRLITPAKILEEILSKDFESQVKHVRMQVVIAMKKVLQGVERYLQKSNEIQPTNYHWKLRTLLVDVLHQYMPTGELLIANWDAPVIPQEFTRFDYMTEVLDVLHLYKRLAPDLLVTTTLPNYLQFLEDIKKNREASNTFKSKFVQLVHSLTPELFAASHECLPKTIGILGRCLVSPETEESARQCLTSIFSNTGLFDDYRGSYEMQIWIDALKHKPIRFFLGQVLVRSHCESDSLQQELSAFREATVLGSEDSENVDEIIEALSEDDFAMVSPKTKNMQVSRVTLMALKHAADSTIHNYLGQVFLNVFYLQTDYQCMQKMMETYKQNVPEQVFEYIVNWPNAEEPKNDIPESCVQDFQELSRAVFRLVHTENHSKEVYREILETAKKHSVPDLIYCHPALLRLFDPTDSTSMCTTFIIEITEHLRSTNIQLSPFLKHYQSRLYISILKLFKSKKQKAKCHELSKVINVLGVMYDECCHILKKVTALTGSDFLNKEKQLNQIYHVTVAIVKHFAFICQQDYTLKPYEGISNILDVLVHLNSQNLDTSELANALCEYFNRFLHQSQLQKDALFVSVACRNEYCKENAKLILTILQHGPLPEEVFSENLESICSKKGLILPILDRFARSFSADLGQITLGKLLGTVQKVLQKPQKAGQHVEKHYEGLCHLIQLYMPKKDILVYLEKIQKSESSEVFLASMFKSMFIKYFQKDAKTSKSVEIHVNNGILTFVHFMVNIFKVSQKKSGEDHDNDFAKLEKVSELFGELLKGLPSMTIQYETLRKNETFKLFQKFCLKHGIGNNKEYLMTILTDVSKLCKFTLDEAVELTEMLMSHSEFMNTILDGPSKANLAIFDFVYVMVKSQPGVMERHHVPVLLSAYTATMHPSDRRLLSVLKLYEASPAQTHFYDFKPFLWGISAGNFYSVRQDVRKGLRRQPRTGDVLDILQLSMIESTITNMPLGLPLRDTRGDECLDSSAEIYDISFILPVLSQLLVSENKLLTYKFIRSGAPSLIVISLASNVKEVRMAGCHVLARFYNHLQSERISKDHLLWIRYIEALAKGTGSIENFKLNNFAAIFMARTSLALANPLDPMYLPLSNYIGVKATPNLTTIPELYTFLHSSDVDYATQRHFILQILADGMRTEADFEVAAKCNTFKLILELCSSSICNNYDINTIFDVLEKATALPVATKILCQNHGFLMWLHNLLMVHGNDPIMTRIVRVLHNVVKCNEVDSKFIEMSLIYLIDNYLLDFHLEEVEKAEIVKTVLLVTEKSHFLNKERLQKIIYFADSKTCDYFLNCNVKTTSVGPNLGENVEVLTHQLVQAWLNHQ